MSNTTKPLSTFDGPQTLQGAFNEIDYSLTVNGFVTGMVGRKITRTIISATIDDFSYFDGTKLLYTIRVTYSNSAHDDVDSVERTA